MIRAPFSSARNDRKISRDRSILPSPPPKCEWRTGRFALELRSGMACKNPRQQPRRDTGDGQPLGTRGGGSHGRDVNAGGRGGCALSILCRYSARQNYGANLYLSIYIDIYIDIYRFIYIYIYIYIYARTHTHIYIYTYIYACARSAVYFRVQGLWEMTARLAPDLVEPDGRPRTRSRIRSCGVVPISRSARQTCLFRSDSRRRFLLVTAE